MMKLSMSPAAGSLLRALIARGCVERNRILLTDVHSSDWQSLTFSGERHQLCLRVTGSDSHDVTARMCDGLEDAEFSIPGLIVADIGLAGTPRKAADGATEVLIEALTIADN
jgi:hypothetical protein